MKTTQRLLLSAVALLGAGLLSGYALTPAPGSPMRAKKVANPFRHPSNPGSTFAKTPEVLSLPTENSGIKDATLLRKTAGGTSLYGMITAGHSDYPRGMYRFNPDGISLMWRDPLFTYENSYAELQTAYYRNGRICGFDHWYEYGYFWGQKYYELDFNTGEWLTEDEDEDCVYQGWFVNLTYDSKSDTIYGYGTDDEEEASTAMFMKTSGKNVFQYEIIKDYGYSQAGFNMQCVSMCYNPIDDNLYGINLKKQFVRIDKETGDQTVLFNVPVEMGLYVTGLVYSAVENLYYWNCNYDKTNGQWGSTLYTIDAANGTFTPIMEFDGGDCFQYLFIVGDNVDNEAPRRPELVSYSFPDGATSGSLVFKMPTEKISGAPISGNLDWKFNVDGGLYSDGTATAGEEVTVEVNNLRNGEHTFSMTAALGDKVSSEVSTTFYVGSDRPKAPAQVILEEKSIYWSAVREGVNGGYIDPAEIEYEVFLNGELYTTTKRTSTTLTLPADAPVQRWQASVVAVYNNMRSTPTSSNTIVAGAPWKMPINIDCTEDMLELMTIVNGNNDDETWEYTDWEDGWYSGQVDSGSGQGSDWVILPPIEFPDADKYYSFYIECMKKANIYPDTWIEVCYGDYPDPAMMEGNYILTRFSPASRDYHTYSNPMFKVPEAGVYYIGIRCITNENHLGCIVGNIRIEDNSIQPESPKAVTDITATPGANGALEATVTFTMPTETVSGATIDANTQLTATVTGDTFVNVTGTPGSTQSATVRTVQGDNRITISVKNGDINGEVANVDVYTGVAIPGSVKNLTGVVSPDMKSITMTWDVPSADKAGGYIDPTTVEYYFAVYNPFTERYDKSLAGVGVTSGTFTLPASWEQDMYSVGVATQNVAGTNGKVMVLDAQMGPAWKLPMLETFEGDGLYYSPWVIYSESGSKINWGLFYLKDIATEWAGNMNVAICGYPDKDNTNDESMLAMPRFTTIGADDAVVLTIKYWAGDQAANMNIRAALYGMEENEIIHSCRLLDTDDWIEAQIKLPTKYINQEWVQIFFDAIFSNNHNYCIIDEVSVADISGVLMTFNKNGSVAAGKGCIEFTGYQDQTAVIFNTAGVKVAERKLSGEQETISIAPGIYMVTVADKTTKLIVR